MGNDGRSKVLGIGNVEIVFASGKRVTLTNVFHVSKMNRNLASEDLLGKPGIKSVFESGKLILSHNGMFVSKGYSSAGMVKLCTNDNVSINNKSVSSTYIVDSITLWHGRLAYIGIGTMKRMIKCGWIECDINKFNKCKICTK